MFHLLTCLLSLLSLARFTLGLSLVDTISGNGFNDAFDYQAIGDPTGGRVHYVDESTARSKNLTFASNGHFVLRADHTTKLSASGPGRDSVRLQSKKQYSNFAMVFDVLHMPQGCGTWPALWTRGDDWPNNGEIDIIEGVNDQGPDHITLHTSGGCSMPASRSETGNPGSNDCTSSKSHNTGCGVTSSDSRSYGPQFNENGGGWFTVQQTNTFVKVWFWSRSAGNVPSDVKNGAKTLNPNGWGTPVAYFPNTKCNIGSKFGPQNIIINLTLCGSWAGSAYKSSGCPSTCVDHVNTDPSSFVEAYWDILSIHVYT